MMRRTPFRPKTPAREPRPDRSEEFASFTPAAPRRSVMSEVAGKPTCGPAPKRQPVRSESLRLAYRAIPCQWEGCGIDDGTVCCAHSNLGEHGKGKAQKADDNRGASLCFVHHQALDQGHTMTGEERRAGWEFAHRRTMRELITRDLWPKDVPVPSDVFDQPLGEWFKNKVLNEYEVGD